MKKPKKPSVDLAAYLRSKGSPLAEHVPSLLKAANRYRVDPRLLVAISGGETSFAKAGAGPAVHNAWGIGPGRAYGSWDEGINAAAKLLRENYIGKGLRSLAAIQRKWAPVGAGNDPRNLNSNWIRTIGTFYGELGGNVNNVTLGWQDITAPVAGKTVTPTTMTPVPVPEVTRSNEGLYQAAMGNLGEIASGRSPSALRQLSSMTSGIALDTADFKKRQSEAAMIAQQNAQVKASTPVAAIPTGMTKARKGMMQIPATWKGTHITDNLDWNHGKRTARDIMAPAGIGVPAPEDGVIYRHGSAQGGQALYFRGDSGTEYWLGHIDLMLPVDTHVKRGDRIASISADHPDPHLHIDRKL